VMLRGCHGCGQVHRVPVLVEGDEARCTRCGTLLARHDGLRYSAQRTAAAALAAAVLYFPAILLPIVEIERMGYRRSASVLGGVRDLLVDGDWFVGGIVLLFSVLLPAVKIVLLLELSLVQIFYRQHRAITYRWTERLGRWSMLDVLLLALLVALVKLGDLVVIRMGPGVLAFSACVFASLMASACFDPHAIWTDESEKQP